MPESESDESWLIDGARIVDPSQSIDRVGRLLMVDGRIRAYDSSDGDLPKNVQRIDAEGRILAPGLVDLGPELGEPGRENDETIATGCMAALAGGYTSIACSANTEPPIDNAASLQFVQQKAARTNLCRVYVIGCVSKLRAGEQLAEIGSLVEAGAVALSDAPRPIENTALLRRALEYCLMFDRPIIDHPEVRSLSHGGVMHEGKTQLVLGLPPMPAEAEDLATSRDLRLVEATGGRLHLSSISTAGSVELCRRAKARDIQFTAGIYPANFHLLDELLRTFDSNCKVNPPLRSQEHVDACLTAIAEGTIDVIASGHRPRSLEKKMQELDAAPFGMISLETALAEAITYLIRPSIIDWSALIAKLSLNPAKIIGIEAGSLAIGKPADCILISPATRWTVEPKEFQSRAYNTPLTGTELYGRVTDTFVGGQRKWTV